MTVSIADVINLLGRMTFLEGYKHHQRGRVAGKVVGSRSERPLLCCLLEPYLEFALSQVQPF